MNSITYMSSLFEEEPRQWGYRGDPHLWKEMRKRFENVEIPDAVEECKALIISAFEDVTKKSIEGDTIRIDRFDHGGMSGGLISTGFWRETAIPLLLSRHSLHKK